jgi:hypothetical protein
VSQSGSSGQPGPTAEPLHALFQRRVAGDDALFHLARLRFAQAGIAAEVHADTSEQLEQVLAFLAPHERLPVVHLNRGMNMLRGRDRAAVAELAAGFAGRISGLVVHDKAEMETRVDDLVAAMQQLGTRLARIPDGPYLFLEYAAGMEPEWFVNVAELLQDVERVSSCIDVGHVGITQACATFATLHRGLDLRTLDAEDERLPHLVVEVQRAVGSALPRVVEMTRSLGRLGKHLHFHLHDGHPLIRGLSDHFSFLTRLPVPFRYENRRSLDTMYGPAGLTAIVSAAVEACSLQRVSFTLEIHQVEGRLPLVDAAGLFGNWQDLTNAERMNYWLSILVQNSMLVSSALHPVTQKATRARLCP